MQYCWNYQLAHSEKIEFWSLKEAIKSDFAPTCTDYCHCIKHDQTIIFYAPLIYMKNKCFVVIFGSSTMMKTDNLNHAIRNSEHKSDKNIFALNTMEEHKHGLEFRHLGINVFTRTWHLWHTFHELGIGVMYNRQLHLALLAVEGIKFWLLVVALQTVTVMKSSSS